MGAFGCDYAWNGDFTAYRCLPHRWTPGSDASYAHYQTDDCEFPEELAAALVDAREEPPAPPALIAPETDLYGDNALDIEF